MNTDRERDARVAIQVLGWDSRIDKYGDWRLSRPDGTDDNMGLAVEYDSRTGARTERTWWEWSTYEQLPPFSSEMDAAWDLTQAIRERGYRFLLTERLDGSGFDAYFMSSRHGAHAFDGAATVAICEAALELVRTQPTAPS